MTNSYIIRIIDRKPESAQRFIATVDLACNGRRFRAAVTSLIYGNWPHELPWTFHVMPKPDPADVAQRVRDGLYELRMFVDTPVSFEYLQHVEPIKNVQVSGYETA